MQVTEWEFSYTDAEEFMPQISIRGTCGGKPPVFCVITPLNRLALLDGSGSAVPILTKTIDEMMQLLLDRVNHELQ